MSAAVGISRQRSVSNKAKGITLPSNPRARQPLEDSTFEPLACTSSLVLYAQGPTVVCLQHHSLAVERRFQKHSKDVILISADNVSETGAGRLVVTYDIGQTAIIWDLFTGEQLSRFVSYESLRVAHWMRNGNIAFGMLASSSSNTRTDAKQETQKARSFSLNHHRASIYLLEPSLTPSLLLPPPTTVKHMPSGKPPCSTHPSSLNIA